MESKAKTPTQSEAIISRFGGPKELCKALSLAGCGRDLATIYRWTYPKSKGGTGGYVPSSAYDDIKKAARMAGVLLRAKDWFPDAET